MNPLKYPLEQLIQIKNRRFEIALKVMEEKKTILEKEKLTLIKVEKERDKVLEHKKDKLQQLRDELDTGTTSDKIKQMKTYLEVVDEKLYEKETKVKNQKEKVEEAKEEFEKAREIMYQRQKDQEKLKMHKEEWVKEVKFWESREESLIQDEIGSVRFVSQKKEKGKKT
jgi:flagellar biosynthesis chaperone FliJ